MNKYLKTTEKHALTSYCSVRTGETKLGQCISTVNGSDFDAALNNAKAQYVLLGIPEDIGIRANFGQPGSAGFWDAFLKSFLNIQSNDFLNGEKIILAGVVDCDDLMIKADHLHGEDLSLLVNEIDVRVETVLQTIFKNNKTPIIIGGGHNNALPIISAANKAFNKKLNIVNIDPHADMRSTERRHSGNGFSFAMEQNLIEFYFQVGLHENYNNNHILRSYNDNEGKMHYFSFDDYLRSKWNFGDLKEFLGDAMINSLVGLELDCDSIENMPSSANTPSGFTANEARVLTGMIGTLLEPCYFHLPEAINASSPINSAKLVSYLVSDFIKARG